MTVRDWDIPGEDRWPIRGSTHVPAGDARSAVVIVHGYLGYKDYGMFPWLASHLCGQGHIVHRINLSHSGMDHGHGRFDIEAVRCDTWSRGVEDLTLVLKAMDRGVLAGQGRGVILLGHSRGGSTSLLGAGRCVLEAAWSCVVGVVSLAAPASLRRLSPEDETRLLSGGEATLSSSRTGQTLAIGAGWLQEQIDDPEAHDLPARVADIRCPIGLIHGTDDQTVDPSDAVTLARANPTRSQVRLVEGGDHVFNTPNPFSVDAKPSQQLADAANAASEWIDGWVA